MVLGKWETPNGGSFPPYYNVSRIGTFVAKLCLFLISSPAEGADLSLWFFPVHHHQVGSLWGVFKFGEIKGKRNYIFLVCAFCIAIAASLMIVLSGPKPK